MKNILIINAHPDPESFCRSLAMSYQEGAEKAGASCRLVNLYELEFNPMLGAGYRIPMPLEPDLIQVQEWIAASQHLVFVYPNWWGTYPALLKGFLDRVFLPGFAFKYGENSSRWEKLLKQKSGLLLVTMDTPVWYYQLGFRAPGHNAMKRCVLHFCGVKPVKSVVFSPIKNSSQEKRKQWLTDAVKRGGKDAR